MTEEDPALVTTSSTPQRSARQIMAAGASRLALVDGMNLLYRAEYGFPARIRNRSGEDITGLFGFVALLRKSLQQCPLTPTHCLVVFDADAPLSRVDLDSRYKSARVPPQVDAHLPFRHLDAIKESLGRLGIPYYEDSVHEADDVIATMSSSLRLTHDATVIFSRDKDFYQLLDHRTFLYDSARGASSLMTADSFTAKYGIAPEQWPDYRALVGDPSDSLPGIRGIGPVRAAAILRQTAHLGPSSPRLTPTELLDALSQRQVHLLNMNAPLGAGEPKPILPSELPRAADVLEAISAWAERSAEGFPDGTRGRLRSGS